MNGLFAQDGYPLLPEYRSLLQNRYRAEVHELDFARDGDGAAERINRWIENQTGGLIQGAIAPASLTADMRFMVLNAIYFKAHWARPFDKRATTRLPFHPIGREPYPVATMRKEMAMFPYLENELVQVLELPYSGRRFSMVIALPRKADGLVEVTKRFCDSTLDVDLRNLKSTFVSLSLPKFKIDGPPTDLIGPLRKLGVRRLFDERQVDLGGISGEKGMCVGLASHKACIQVDEEGTVAAAATGGGGMGGVPEVVEFRADHPFLFLIRDRLTGTALFIGQLVAPAAAE